MSEFVSLGNISVAAIRDYLFAKRIDAGDSLVFNPADYSTLLDEVRESGEPIDIPLNVFGVRILKDTGLDIPAGKVQIVKNEQL